VFDLIMTWKTELNPIILDNDLKKKGMAKIVKCQKKKDQLVQFEDLDKHCSNIQAVLINPPWDTSNVISC